MCHSSIYLTSSSLSLLSVFCHVLPSSFRLIHLSPDSFLMCQVFGEGPAQETAPMECLNPLIPNRQNCTYFFLRSNCKKLILTLSTHKSPKAYYTEHWDKAFLLQIKPLKVNPKLNWRIFIFAPSHIGTNGLILLGRVLEFWNSLTRSHFVDSVVKFFL